MAAIYQDIDIILPSQNAVECVQQQNTGGNCAIYSKAVGNVVDIFVGGVKGSMLIDPGGPKQPDCNAEFAERAHFSGYGPTELYRVGPISIQGGRGSETFQFLDKKIVYSAKWALGKVVRGADCWIGPDGLGYQNVRFLIKPPLIEKRTYRYSYLLGSLSGETTTLVYDIDRRKVYVSLDFTKSYSVLSAPATIIVSRAYGAMLKGPSRDVDIWEGVSRPVRELVVTNGLSIGIVALSKPYSRVYDFGDSSKVTVSRVSDRVPNEIIVTGKPHYIEGFPSIRIGRDDLSRCSSILFRNKEKIAEIEC